MKIIFVLHSLANYAGIERVMSDKMNYLSRQGHQVTLVTYEQGLHPLSYPLEPSVGHVDLACRFFTLYRYPMPLRLLKMWQMKRRFRQALSELASRLQPDVIAVPSNAGDFMAEIMSVAPHARKIVESHGALPAIMHAETLQGKIRNRLLLRAIRRCDLLIALTRSDQQCWQRHLRRTAAVPNPVAFYSETVDLSLKQPGRILAIGRLHPQKRFDRLVDAFALVAADYPGWTVTIFGSGDDQAALERQIESRGLAGRIRIEAPTTQIRAEYQKSQMLVLSSDYEGLPLVLLEAMACGVVPVATRCPFGPSEVIDDGVTGLLAEMDVADLAEKMAWLMGHDEERRAMSLRAHQAAARYRRDVVMGEWERAYLSVSE